uniref:Apple domain-containing protein n=1 Tax=Plectus sambesii TaxID=2011161 RepID=A0A914XGR2_9BILA
MSSNLPESALTCDWNKKKDGLDPNSLTVPKKHRNALNANECRTFCEMKMLPGCGSYGFNSNSRVGDNNCFLLPSTLIEAEINLAQPGSYEIYKYECT